MDNSSIANSQDLSFLQCYICFQTVKKPRMCPSCSKLACQNCLRTWIEESKPECPHCRKPLLLGSFADCQRFVNDIKHLLNGMDSNQKMKEKCSQHKIEMSYFCEDCNEPICSDCGMFGKHRSHSIIHLSKVYQQNKNKILNQLAKFDNKIQIYRKNGFIIKQEIQKLLLLIGQKKNFIEEYFVTLIERIDEEYKQKKEKIQTKYDQNIQEIQFLQTFRENICQELQCKTQKELITKSEEFISYIKSLCDRETQFQEQDYSFETIHELVPKYRKFVYKLRNYTQITESIVYSDAYQINGMEWRLKIYPKGNGLAKNSHISVFLQLSKGYENEDKYEYKIQLINHLNLKETTIRQYASKFDIGECWGYNQFISIEELDNGFLDEENCLEFQFSVRNPNYRSLVRDQQKYIKALQNKLNCIENPLPLSKRQKMNELAQSKEQKQLSSIKKFGFVSSEREEEKSINFHEEQEVKIQENLEVNHLQDSIIDQLGLRFGQFK